MMEPALSRPPAGEVVIVRHRKEKKSKCSLEPLVGREGIRFLTYPLREDPPALSGFVRLSIEGPPLGPADRERGLLMLDATWRLVLPMERLFHEVEPRSLPALETAYPRVSKLFEDPAGGLASIEALFAAFLASGRDAEGLLDAYRGAARFLECNEAALADLRRKADLYLGGPT
ncbi:MAG: hypothetical protein ACYTFT_06425 [Planctomycetota bacterium]